MENKHKLQGKLVKNNAPPYYLGLFTGITEDKKAIIDYKVTDVFATAFNEFTVVDTLLEELMNDDFGNLEVDN